MQSTHARSGLLQPKRSASGGETDLGSVSANFASASPRAAHPASSRRTMAARTPPLPQRQAEPRSRSSNYEECHVKTLA